MILIITGTITPMVQDSEIVIKDTEERIQQYLESISFYIKSRAFTKIVFGENSCFPKERLDALFELARREHVLFEYLSFPGNEKEVFNHGKGYGEGEIMEYVFQHSQLLKDETYFLKITGRLIVDNIVDIVKRSKPDQTYMNIPNRTIREWYDTRVYVMPVKQFEEYFKTMYSKVDDAKGHYLEIVYTQIIKEQKIKVRNLPRYPRIKGVSGSTGNQYVYTEWKCKLKDILSLFGCYKVKEENRK